MTTKQKLMHIFLFSWRSFKNGSLTRERIRNVYANRSWDQFDALLNCTPPGNHGYVGMFFDEQEITPKIQGTFRFDASDQRINAFEEAATEVRAVIEGQLLAKRVHAERLGFRTGEWIRVIERENLNLNFFNLFKVKAVECSSQVEHQITSPFCKF